MTQQRESAIKIVVGSSGEQKRWGLGKVKGGVSTLPTATGLLTSQSGGLTTYLEQ